MLEQILIGRSLNKIKTKGKCSHAAQPHIFYMQIVKAAILVYNSTFPFTLPNHTAILLLSLPFPLPEWSWELKAQKVKNHRLRTISWKQQWNKKINGNSNNINFKKYTKERVMHMEKCSPWAPPWRNPFYHTDSPSPQWSGVVSNNIRVLVMPPHGYCKNTTAAQIKPVEGTALKAGITQVPFVLPGGPWVLEKRK